MFDLLQEMEIAIRLAKVNYRSSGLLLMVVTENDGNLIHQDTFFTCSLLGWFSTCFSMSSLHLFSCIFFGFSCLQSSYSRV